MDGIIAKSIVSALMVKPTVSQTARRNEIIVGSTPTQINHINGEII